jgi:ATP-dependent helicase HrpA
VHPGPWRRFEIGLLETQLDVDTGQGTVTVYPTLRRVNGTVQFGLEWTTAEAQHRFRSGAAALARILLARQSGDLHKKLAADTRLLLAAGNQIKSDELIDWILQRTFYSASFQEDDPPRSRLLFEQQVDQSRNRLYERCEEFRATAEGWFATAREIRRMLDDPRASNLKEAAQESREHLRSLFAGESLHDMPLHWVRQLARYLKAEKRRWQRALERRTESPAISQEIVTWAKRYRKLEASLRDQDRWVPELDEFRGWIEEYRISLYAQELKTLGPISGPRLEGRAAAIEAWLRR